MGRGAQIRHPCPTIVDHLHLPSTNGADFDVHTNTQASVTWRGFAEEDMATPEWWQTPTTWLPPEWTREVAAMLGPCQWCGKRRATMRSEVTGIGICKPCGALIALEMMRVDGKVKIVSVE